MEKSILPNICEKYKEGTLNKWQRKRPPAFNLSIALLSLICSVLGLALSVSFERLSTSSLQISILAILLFAFCLIQKFRLHQSKGLSVICTNQKICSSKVR